MRPLGAGPANVVDPDAQAERDEVLFDLRARLREAGGVLWSVDPAAGGPPVRVFLDEDGDVRCAVVADPCHCGDPDPAGCMNLNAGYPWCRPCGEHHRPPECAIDEQGRALASDGTPWEDMP